MSKSKKLDFRPNEFVVYPAHGVGQIVSIDKEEIAGIPLELFENDELFGLIVNPGGYLRD